MKDIASPLPPVSDFRPRRWGIPGSVLLDWPHAPAPGSQSGHLPRLGSEQGGDLALGLPGSKEGLTLPPGRGALWPEWVSAGDCPPGTAVDVGAAEMVGSSIFPAKTTWSLCP